MAMLCPKCRTATFDSFGLEAGLDVLRCHTCAGLFIASDRYFSFLALDSTDGPAPSAEAAPPDLQQMKFCPACGKFMHYYPVGHGLAFGIDKCNTCGGIWLNAGEWEDLRARGLHRKLHAISSDIWQDRVRQEATAATERAAMLRRLGTSDWGRVEEVGQWLEKHPHAAEILAYWQHVVAR